MEAVEAVPVYGAAFTVIDSMMYGIIGDTDAAKAKLYEMPMAFVGLGLEYKAAKLASTAFKAEEKTIATTEKMIASGEKEITNSEKVIGNSERTIADSERAIATAKDAIATDGKSLAKLERELVTEKRAIITGKEIVEAGQKAIAKIENEIADIEKSIAAENKTITTAREAIANEREMIATEEKTIVKGEGKLNFDLQLFASNSGASKAELGRKLDYIFGKETGSKHNIDRSVAVERHLNSVGIFDNAEGRQLVENNLKKAFNNPASMLKTQENGWGVRKLLLSGPNGVIKVESVWDGSKLITVTLFGGR